MWGKNRPKSSLSHTVNNVYMRKLIFWSLSPWIKQIKRGTILINNAGNNTLELSWPDDCKYCCAWVSASTIRCASTKKEENKVSFRMKWNIQYILDYSIMSREIVQQVNSENSNIWELTFLRVDIFAQGCIRRKTDWQKAMFNESRTKHWQEKEESECIKLRLLWLTQW